MARSPAWGNIDFPVIADHDQFASWEAGGLYDYTAGYGLSGDTHPGWDIKMPVGTMLFALADGVVDYIRDESYGTKEIVIRVGDHRHLYTHTSARLVSAGQKVIAGQPIGKSGDPTGLPHLHFEHRIKDAAMREGWRIVDPEPLLTKTVVATVAGGTAETVYTPDAPVAGESLGSAAAWIAHFEKVGVNHLADVAQYVNTIYEFCVKDDVKLGAHKLICQAIHETSDNRKVPGKYIPFTSIAWDHRNPAGIGVTSDEMRGWYTFPNGRDAALAHMIRVCWYTKGLVPESLKPFLSTNPRALPEAVRGKRHTLREFGNADWQHYPTWAASDGYGQNWADTLNENRPVFIHLRPDSPAPTPEPAPAPPKEPAVAMIKHVIPNSDGSSFTIYLPDWITVHIRWVTHPNTTNRVRVPLQTRSTFHDPGNPRTTHWGEFQWLAGGRQGGEPGGYNAITGAAAPGKGEVIICQYLNENTWHAGTPEGNRTSWGTEAAYGANMDWNTCFETACAWHGGLLEGTGRSFLACVLHQFWTGKWCSAQVLNRGLKGVMMQKIEYYWNLSRAARNGASVPTPSTGTYATPMLPKTADGRPWDGNSDLETPGGKFEGQRVLTTVTNGPLNKRQWASTQSLFTGAAYETGAQVQLLGWVKGELVDGISEWWVDADGNRLWAGGFDVEPKIDNAWEELPSETPTGMVAVNGRIYYPLYPDTPIDAEGDGPPPLGREITIHRDGKLHKWAGTTSEEVGTVTAGDTKVFRYWTRGEELPLTLKDGSEAVEMIWFAEDLHSGARMWSGLSEERPD